MKNTSKPLKFPEPRAWDDIYSFTNLTFPSLDDPPRLINRIGNNLIYYQTNYLMMLLGFCFLANVTHPQQFLTGLGTFVFLCAILIVGAERIIQEQCRLLQKFNFSGNLNKPLFKVVNLVFGNGFIFKILGSLAFFLWSIGLPIAVILTHAAFRKRNIKNKIENKLERAGIHQSPMGAILKKLEWYLSEIYDSKDTDDMKN